MQKTNLAHVSFLQFYRIVVWVIPGGDIHHDVQNSLPMYTRHCNQRKL